MGGGKLRIDKGQIKGGFTLAGLLLDLESDLGTSVDLVTTGSLDQDFLFGTGDDANENRIYKSKHQGIKYS